MAMLSGIVGLKSLIRAAISCRTRCTIQELDGPLATDIAAILPLQVSSGNRIGLGVLVDAGGPRQNLPAVFVGDGGGVGR